MNIKHFRLTSIFFLVLGLATSNPVLAQDIEINSASPDLGEQGSINLHITIKGKGFGKSVKQIRFLLHCEAGDTACIDNPDPGGITVNSFKVDDSETITTSIDIAETAVVAGFDIAMTTRGRGGKGTTFRSAELFSVKLRGNQTFASCDVFAPNGTCNCTFGKDPDTGIHTMLADCETSETLWMGDGHRQVWGTSQTNWRTLRVVNDINGVFHGSTVIANTDHRAGVKNLNIVFDSDVTRGCAEGEIQSAVSFRLHGGINISPTGNSFLQILSTSIDSSDDPLCTGAEIVRESEYTELHEDGKDWKVRIETVDITDGSYVVRGIRYDGIRPQHSINPPMVFDNTIGSPACVKKDPSADPESAWAIEYGPILLSDPTDPSSQITGIVQSNTIRMANSCDTVSGLGGVGIMVVGEPCFDGNGNPCLDPSGNPVAGDQTTVEVNKNDISGALFGVMVDFNVVDINFSGNKLTGDDELTTLDIGIDSEAQCTREKGKPNKIVNYNTDRDHFGCQ